MFTVETNFEDFKKQLLKAADDIELFERELTRSQATTFWKKYRSYVVDYFRHMQSLHERIPVFDSAWEDFKTEAVGISDQTEILALLKKYGKAPHWLTRYPGDGDYLHPVVRSDPWRATGIMNRVLESEWANSGNDQIEIGDDIARISMMADVSGLKNSYPVEVDEKLMERSGQSIGVMRLLVWQQQQLFDLMERDFTSFAEAVMARGGGTP